MKGTFQIILGIWSAIMSFITPMWLTLIVLNITGQIYKYDDSMDKGAAGIIGAALLIIWLLFAVLPGVLFIKRLYVLRHKYVFIALTFMIVLMVLAAAVCNWDIVKFWTTPNIHNLF